METESRFNLDIANEEQKQEIKRIEALNIGAAQKADLVLVLLGVKNATEVMVYQQNDSPEKVRETIVDEVKLRLAESQIKSRSINLVAQYAVARDQETADQLSRLDPGKDHEEFGKMMSFPQTAIDAFVAKTSRLKSYDYPGMSDFVVQFALSRDNWQEEIKLLKYWNQLIKKYAPDLYRVLKEPRSKEEW